MQWPSDMGVAEREEIIDEISTTILLSAAKGGPNISADQAVPRLERDVLYLQFKEACDRRLQYANEMIIYVHKIVARAPKMTLVNQKMNPGPDTIEVWGPAWSDKPVHSTNSGQLQ